MNGTILREVDLENDMQDLMDIEEICFQYPWTPRDWREIARHRNTVNLVVEHRKYVIGILSYELQKNCVEILNIAIHPRFWRKGIGTKLIEQLKSRVGVDPKYKQIILHVREKNLDAQLFFKALNFRAIEIVKEHYESTHEDAYKFCFPVFVTASQKSKK